MSTLYSQLQKEIKDVAEETNNLNLATDIMLGFSIAESITTLILFIADRPVPEESRAIIEKIK